MDWEIAAAHATVARAEWCGKSADKAVYAAVSQTSRADNVVALPAEASLADRARGPQADADASAVSTRAKRINRRCSDSETHQLSLACAGRGLSRESRPTAGYRCTGRARQ
jgi:hypothetical protein